MKIKGLLLTSLLFISTTSQAAFHCTVDVMKVLVYSNGSINVMHSGRNNYTVICNLKTEANGGIYCHLCYVDQHVTKHKKSQN